MAKDKFTKSWIIETAIPIIDRYEAGVLTIRGLHYKLVAAGMTNTMLHYKRVVKAMIDARWDNIVEFEAFSDHDRVMIGKTEYEETTIEKEVKDVSSSIEYWMENYYKNRWENQSYYPEVFIEKKALQGVFAPVCKKWNVSLGACKGYPSLTFLNDAAKRFSIAEEIGKIPVILYFGDYDPSGEDIPRSIVENLDKLGVTIELKRILLMKEEVLSMSLPPAPIKPGDSRSAEWDGLGQVELDAVEPDVIQDYCTSALEDIFDDDKFEELKDIEAEETIEYKAQLKEFVKTL